MTQLCDVVWAKIRESLFTFCSIPDRLNIIVSASYPWWPAVIFEEDDPELPENIYNGLQRERMKPRKDDDLFVIRFFDKHMSWFVACLLETSCFA